MNTFSIYTNGFNFDHNRHNSPTKLFIMPHNVQNLMQNIESIGGRESVTTARKLEKIRKLIATTEEDLTFNYRCIKQNIIPSSLKIKAPDNTPQSRIAAKKASRGFTNARIKKLHCTVRFRIVSLFNY